MKFLSKLLAPRPLPFSLDSWKSKAHCDQLNLLCEAWATQGYGAPVGVYLFYLIKIGLYVAAWLFFCSFSADLGSLASFSTWWSHPDALLRFVLWSILFEIMGLGCGSGPLTGRYFPPLGGFLYFARPGTLKLPIFPGLPLVGKDSRGWGDIILYLTFLGLLVWALVSPTIPYQLLLAIVCILPVLGILDKTLYLAARSEHYLIAAICFLFPEDTLVGLKWVWLAIWWGAATSKLNRHFPAVVCVMLSNHAVLQWPWFRKQLYQDYPTDLRPSTLASILAHSGTLTEYLFPLLLLIGNGGTLTLVGLGIMLGFHIYITTSIPMGVPLEWNVIMVFGAFVLFGEYASVSLFTPIHPVLSGILLLSLLLVPLVGNLVPKWVSFLLSFRYYAGNWAYGIYLFKKGTEEKLDQHLTKSANTVKKQLSWFYDEDTTELLLAKVQSFRVMHLHGRALQYLVPKAVEDIEQYIWRDGELVAGVALGWNFGEGHLHTEQLLTAIQKRCGFQEGELRCIFVESQPFFRPQLDWRIVDAKTGLLDSGKLDVKALLAIQPYTLCDPI